MPAFYVPARDSRHRVACIALYRALLQQVPRIALPNDLLTPVRPEWTTTNPIKYLVRSGFRRNKNDTSPRLITSALKSGYRFLTLLTHAQDPTSPQYSEIVSFLRERHAQFPPAPPPPAEGTHQEPPIPKQRIPLLTKVSPPGADPVYEPTVRPLPLSQLTGGRRRVPNVELANSHSFLRIAKPQSHFLANVLRRKFAKRQQRVTRVAALDEEELPAARLEDAWEEILAKQARREGVDIEDVVPPAAAAADGRNLGKNQTQQDDLTNWLRSDYSEFARADDRNRARPAAADGRSSSSYEDTVRQYGVLHIKTQLDEELKDIMARTQAMINLVREEQQLADKEKSERKQQRRKAWEERMRAEHGPEWQPPDVGKIAS